MHHPEEACSPGAATRLAKRRSMDGAVPSTPPSSGKGKRRDALSDYRGDVSGALDVHAATNVPRGSSGDPEPTDEEMHDRSLSESRSVSSDDADAREGVAAVAREAAVDRKGRDETGARDGAAFRSATRTNETRVSGGDRVVDETLGGSPDDVFRVERRVSAARDEEAGEDASVALARALMEEEQREWQNRMLALAGVDDPDDEEDEGVDVDGMTYEELTELGERIGTQSKGASEEALAALTRFRCDEGRAADEEECCAVCRLGFEVGDACLGLPRCGHVYHAACLEPWLAENKCCPLCKTEIEAEAEAAA